MQKIIFSGWLGLNPMSEQRTTALLSLIRHTACAHIHVTHDTLKDWIHPRFPLHPLFPLLSSVHQSDYLRAYLLHVYGGGYSDVKHTSKNWRPFFDQLDRSAAFGIGYTEVGPHGVARVGGPLEQEMQANYQRIIGFCAMIFRPRTEFTEQWYGQVWDALTRKAEALQRHPARHPQDQLGAQFTDGSVSEYPFRWTEIGGNIFHPLVYAHADRILHADMAPSFTDYR